MKELYLSARYGPSRIGEKGAVAVKFLKELGLERFEGDEWSFKEQLKVKLLKEVGLEQVLKEVANVGAVNPALLCAVAEFSGVKISKTSAHNLLRLLVELGLVTRLRTWAVYTPNTRDRIIAILASKGEVKVSDLERLVEGDVRRVLVEMWAEGSVEIEGSRKGPVPGPIGLPREFVRKWGAVIPVSVIEEAGLTENPRLERFIERRTGEVAYSVVVRGDDRVRLVVSRGHA